jgi:hypothetical protein
VQKRICNNCNVEGWSTEFARWGYIKTAEDSEIITLCKFCFDRRQGSFEYVNLVHCMQCGKAYYSNEAARKCCDDYKLAKYNYVLGEGGGHD